MRSRRQRMAISQAEIAKKSKLYGDIVNGFNAFKKGLSLGENPFDPDSQIGKYQAWMNGWLMGQLQAGEKK